MQAVPTGQECMSKEEHEAISPYHVFSMYKLYELLTVSVSRAPEQEDAFRPH